MERNLTLYCPVCRLPVLVTIEVTEQEMGDATMVGVKLESHPEACANGHTWDDNERAYAMEVLKLLERGDIEAMTEVEAAARNLTTGEVTPIDPKEIFGSKVDSRFIH
jgi:hypothetical protein